MEARIQVVLNLDEEQTKSLFKQAFMEMVESRDQALYELVAEVLEELALGKAIQEAEESEVVGREEVFEILEGND